MTTDSQSSDTGGGVDVDALVQEAVARRRGGDADGAAQRFELALAAVPGHAGALTSYAMLRLAGGDFTAAIDLGRRAVAAEPERRSAHHVLGQALCRAGALTEGITVLRHAASLDPDAFDIRVHLGLALADAGELGAAEACLRQACTLAPQSAAAHISLGNVQRRLHRPGDALAAYTRAVELDPGIVQAHNNLGTVRSEIGDAAGAIDAFERALALDPDRAATWSNLLLALQRADHVSTTAIVDASRAFGQRIGQSVARLPPVSMPPRRDRRLRIGYVSADCVQHAVAVFLEPLLAHHDHTRFAITLYHTGQAHDAVTERLAQHADAFVRVAADSDAALAARIRRDAIDILVDLNGHTAGNRLTVFAMKPAPVQATWLGYLGTTGLDAMDWRLSDAVADPVGLTDAQHVEALWRLPHTQWCYQPYPFAPAVAPAPCIARGRVTFASLCNPGKVSPTAIRMWGRILAALPEARLLLISSPLPQRTAQIDGLLAAAGVAAERIIHRPLQSTLDYLALYGEVDIALDTTPYSGGTTTCDALWMGVPVVCLAGERSVARSAASILHSVGLNELVATDEPAYAEIATALARDPVRLRELRASMRARLQASPLLDARRFARDVETAYTAMADKAIAAQGRRAPSA